MKIIRYNIIVYITMLFTALVVFYIMSNVVFCKCSLVEWNLFIREACQWCETECKECNICCCDEMALECLEQYEKHHNVTIYLNPRPPCILDLCNVYK